MDYKKEKRVNVLRLAVVCRRSNQRRVGVQLPEGSGQLTRHSSAPCAHCYLQGWLKSSVLRALLCVWMQHMMTPCAGELPIPFTCKGIFCPYYFPRACEVTLCFFQVWAPGRQHPHCFSITVIQARGKCLVKRRCLINTCWINGWNKEVVKITQTFNGFVIRFFSVTNCQLQRRLSLEGHFDQVWGRQWRVRCFNYLANVILLTLK